MLAKREKHGYQEKEEPTQEKSGKEKGAGKEASAEEGHEEPSVHA
jgi:hypothetical protein